LVTVDQLPVCPHIRWALPDIKTYVKTNKTNRKM